MALLSVASELGAEGTWAADIKFNNNDVDYHFKKTLLLIICYTAKIFSALQVEIQFCFAFHIKSFFRSLKIEM